MQRTPKQQFHKSTRNVLIKKHGVFFVKIIFEMFRLFQVNVFVRILFNAFFSILWVWCIIEISKQFQTFPRHFNLSESKIFQFHLPD